MRRFEKKKMDFASAYADEINAILMETDQEKTDGAQDDKHEQRQQQASQMSLAYVNELEEQLKQLKRSVEMDEEGSCSPVLATMRNEGSSGEWELELPEDDARRWRASDGTHVETSNRTKGGRGGTGIGALNGEHDAMVLGSHDKTRASADVAAEKQTGSDALVAEDEGEALRPSNAQVSSRYRVSSTAEENEVFGAAETGSSLGELMSKYRDADDDAMAVNTSRRFFEKKRGEYKEDLALVASMLDENVDMASDDVATATTNTARKPIDGKDSDVWAATHSDDEGAYHRFCRTTAGAGGAEDPMDVCVDATYHSDSEIEFASSKGEYCYDVSVMDLHRYFEERRSQEEMQKERQRQRLLSMQQHEQRRRGVHEKSLRRNKIRVANGSEDGHEYYDPHENCCKFLGPRSQHGDGLPAPEFRGRASQTNHSSRGFTSKTGKKKSIMQAKMEQVRKNLVLVFALASSMFPGVRHTQLGKSIAVPFSSSTLRPPSQQQQRRRRRRQE